MLAMPETDIEVRLRMGLSGEERDLPGAGVSNVGNTGGSIVGLVSSLTSGLTCKRKLNNYHIHIHQGLESHDHPHLDWAGVVALGRLGPLHRGHVEPVRGLDTVPGLHRFRVT